MTDVVDKVRKLLAKARDAGASEAEAETCARKARELMDEHELTDEAVREKNAGPTMSAHQPKYMDPWRRDIIHCAARYYGCVAVFNVPRKSYVLFGRESSRLVAESMVQYLDDTVRRLALEWRHSVDGTRAQLLDFERGCGTRIAYRLHKMCEVMTTPSPENSGTTSVALVDELGAATGLMQSTMRTSTSRPKTQLKGDGARAGRAAADSVSLGGQVGGGSATVRIGK